jgi:hypothetical protein
LEVDSRFVVYYLNESIPVPTRASLRRHLLTTTELQAYSKAAIEGTMSIEIPWHGRWRLAPKEQQAVFDAVRDSDPAWYTVERALRIPALSLPDQLAYWQYAKEGFFLPESLFFRFEALRWSQSQRLSCRSDR